MVKPVIGATGEFPHGKLNKTDEGELRMAIWIKDTTIIMTFGKPVAWLGLKKEDARNMANFLLEKVAELEGQNG